jgi:uncharacterized protein YbjT (DUF2867 family)
MTKTVTRLIAPLMLAALAAATAQGAEPQPVVPAGEQLILVGGATGRTGYRIVQLLVQRGYRVRGMTRDRERAIDMFGEDIEWVAADVRDPDSLGPAFAGVDKFINAIGTESRGGENTPEEVQYLGMLALVDAARASGVSYFGLISSGGVADAAAYIAQNRNDSLTWTFKGEEYLRASRLDYTIVRPGGLRDYPAGENGILLLQQDDVGAGLITRSDVADVMVECLAHPDAVGKTFAIVNYLALDPEGWRRDLAKLAPDPVQR